MPLRIKQYTAAIWFAAMVLSGVAAAQESSPCWIWEAETNSSDMVRFERMFQTTSPTTAIRFRCAPAYAELTVMLDGKIIAVAVPNDPIQEIAVESRLPAGEHSIKVQAKGVDGPSAFFVQFDFEFQDATRKTIVSDSTWQIDDSTGVDNLGPVNRRLMVPASRRVGIDVVDNYEQWKQALSTEEGTDPANFLIAPGFEIRRVRSALPNEDSWVSLAFDSQGRAIIAKESKGLLRMTLSPEGDMVTEAALIEDTLQECRGLTFVGESLFVNANNSKGLYALPSNGDRFAQPQLVYSSTGGVGHGRNDLAVGPDEKLYSIHGDSVGLPVEAFDYTSRFRAARRGQKTSEGHLLRIDPKSGFVEVLAAGLRNPFGIDFNADGEVFTYDADAEYDMGSPWYRPTRVNHLVTGGDYGWRGVTKSWPSYYPDHPDNARPNLDIGKGSPTAVKFGTRSNFPQPYRDALFILDWAYGRMLAVHMIPRGSSYLMAGETFLKGRPLNVTDLDFAPSGDMYFVTGGRKTQSALYRIRYVGGAGSPSIANDHAPSDSNTTPFAKANGRFAGNARRLRRELELALLGPPDKRTLDRAWNLLSNDDAWIQQAARNVVEWYPMSLWESRALSETEVTTAMQALTALARSQQVHLYRPILRRLNELLPKVESAAGKHMAFYVYGLCLRASDQLDDDIRRETESLLNAQYPSRLPAGQSYAHNRLLSELLVKLHSNDVVPKTIELLRSSTSQTEQMHYLYVLRNVSHGWTIDRRRDFFTGLAQAKHFMGGAGMGDFLKRIRDEAIATLSKEEQNELGTLIKDAAAIRESSVELPARSFVRKWTVDDLLPVDTTFKPDKRRGAKVFAAASCIQCHRFGTLGTLIGPDLTSVSRRFSRRDILASIIDPSSVIAENYRSLQIVTNDGKTYVGQPTIEGDFRSPVLRLLTNPARPFDAFEIEKNKIESQKTSGVSWMPRGLLDSFSKDEILDLITYLESPP